MWIVIPRLPWSRGSTEAHYIRGDDAHLFGVTVRASLAAVNHATMRFSRGKRLHGTRCCPISLRLKLARGENAKRDKRKDEKAKAGDKCNDKRITED